MVLVGSAGSRSQPEAGKKRTLHRVWYDEISNGLAYERIYICVVNGPMNQLCVSHPSDSLVSHGWTATCGVSGP